MYIKIHSYDCKFEKSKISISNKYGIHIISMSILRHLHISQLYLLLLVNSTGYCIMTTPFDYVFDNVYMYDIKYKLPLGEQCNLL